MADLKPTLESIGAGIDALQQDAARKNAEDELRLMEARKIAADLVEHAKKEARQMLLEKNLDIGKIPLICLKIVSIDTRLGGIEGNLVWGVRIVIGAVLLSLCTLVFKTII